MIKVIRVSGRLKYLGEDVEVYRKISDDPWLREDLVNDDGELPLTSRKKIGWECRKCEDIWSEPVAQRKRYDYCPGCQERKSKRCLIQDCETFPGYNYPQYDWKAYCKNHSNLIKIPKTKPQICDGKSCGTGKHVGGGNYLCEHNNLAVLYPDLIKEWNSKNIKGPGQYASMSLKKVWWKCNKSICDCHEWEAIIASRTRGKGCPFCSGHKVCRHSNLAYFKPELAEEWFSQENGLTPSDVSIGTNTMVTWKCDKHNCDCNFLWKATIKNRTVRNSNCPYCDGKKVCIHESVASLDIIAEWDYDKNNINPKETSKYSHAKVWWKCAKNHEWKVAIGTRYYSGSRCPICFNSDGCSISQIEWLEDIMRKEGIFIQHARNIGEYKISGIGKVDSYCSDTNTIYEYHGDFWHGNPKVFYEDVTHPNYKITFGELYKRTLVRDNQIKDSGYNLIVRWETEIE